MIWHDTSYKNRPKSLAMEVGRIHRDLDAQDGKEISKLSSNLHAIPTAPITTSEGESEACCCDRVVYVSKDGAGDFDTIQEAINDIAAYESPSADTPWVVYICPGDYHEDVVGANFVSLVGIGTKKDAVRIIGVDGPTYTCPDGIHSVENILFRLEVTVASVSPILIDAFDVPATLGETHIFSNCQFEITSVAQTGELVRVSGTGITFEHCDFYYNNTDATVGAFTHELIKLMSGSITNIISCNFKVNIVDEEDDLNVFSETAGQENKLMVKDCRVKLLMKGGGGDYIFYNAAGDGENKYIQDNHIEIRSQVSVVNFTYYIAIPNAKAMTVTSNNNLVIFEVDLPMIANIALTNTLESHHDQFIDLRNGTLVPYTNLGTFNYVHSPMPGTASIRQGGAAAALPVETLEQIDVDEPFWKVIGTAASGNVTRSIVDEDDVVSSTLLGWVKIEVKDDGNQIADRDYFMPVYELIGGIDFLLQENGDFLLQENGDKIILN